MNYRKLLFFALVTFFCQPLMSQYIVKTTDQLAKELMQTTQYKASASLSADVIYPELNLFRIDGPVTEQMLDADPGIVAYEKDQELELRDDPNDLFFPDQYSLSLINIAPIWETLPDAVDYGGREVVVAILDDGFQLDHPELVDNWYTNTDEIPNNGIDDDENGIIDDYQGWNQNRGNGQHAVETHGTSVAGIIGAKGNNSEGIAGVSWNVKMLPISGITFKSDIIGALREIAELRRSWNESNGEDGAYIVVTSYSGGIPSAFPDGVGNPVWCELYNELGELGVLSIGATVNKDEDIDVSGDMPSLCESPYLIVTTNIDQNAVKVRNAGFSQNSVDIGAPGSDIITTNVGNNYNTFTGTSAAAPHVAGVAVQLFCTPCPVFYETIINDPARSVLDVRSAILNTTIPESSLEAGTTTGGRIDAGAALNAMQIGICGGSQGNLSTRIKALDYDQDVLRVSYETPNNDEYQYIITNRLGQVMASGEVRVPFFGEKILELQIGQVPTGVYVVTLVGAENAASTTFFSPGF